MSDLTMEEYQKHHDDIADAADRLNDAISRAKVAGVTTSVTCHDDMVRVTTSTDLTSTSDPLFK